MTLGISTSLFTQIHVLISLIGIASGFVVLFGRLEELNRLRRHHRRDRVLVDQLRMRITPQQDAEIVEPSDNSL